MGMSDDWDEAAAPVPAAGGAVISVAEIDVKLFNKWACDEVNVSDMSLQDYIAVKEKSAKYLPHSAGRYAAKRFRKAQCPIVERLVNSLMVHGRNNGKKLLTVRIVKHSFEIIHLLTGENPLQVLVNAIINSGPREDSKGLVVPELCVVKLSMFHLSDASIKLSGFCAPVLVRPLSVTSNLLPSVWLMSSSTLPKEAPTAMLSRRRMNLSVWLNPTDR